MTDGALQRLLDLRLHQQDGRRSPHKPLLALVALGRLLSTGSSELPWSEAEHRLADLLAEFGRPSTTGRAQSAAYPFTRLRADGEVAELVVDPAHRGAGHGSRLLHACVDTLRADRFVRATTWLTTTDDARRRFLTEAGWAPDGAYRELDLRGDGTVQVKQVRLHTDLRTD